MKILFTLLFSIPLLLNAQQTLTKTMLHNGVTRQYIVYIPAIYNGSAPVPLMFNFHGFGMTASNQMAWTGMRPVADTAGFILVYPQGTLFSGSSHWNVGSWTAGSTADDIGFTNAMIDTIAANYNIDLNRVYSCGFSNGGYFSFVLACQLSNRIAAIGAVGGTMSTETFTSCNPSHPTPVVTIHGTVDPTVSYSGGTPANSKSLAAVNSYWASYNNTVSSPAVSTLPDINTSDGSTVELSLYNNGNNCTSVAHYKVIGGGHDWPGSWGNMDINASKVIWSFVSKYDITGLIGCGITAANEVNIKEKKISIYPNPTKNHFTIESNSSEAKEYFIYSIIGELVTKGTIRTDKEVINFTNFPQEIYVLKIGDQTIKLVKTD